MEELYERLYELAGAVFEEAVVYPGKESANSAALLSAFGSNRKQLSAQLADIEIAHIAGEKSDADAVSERRDRISVALDEMIRCVSHPGHRGCILMLTSGGVVSAAMSVMRGACALLAAMDESTGCVSRERVRADDLFDDLHRTLYQMDDKHTAGAAVTLRAMFSILECFHQSSILIRNVPDTK